MRYVLIVLALIGASLLSVSGAVADAFPLMCHTGGGMSASIGIGNGFSVTVSFKRASHGFSEQDPPKGTCAWNDRPTNPDEPLKLHVGDPTIAPLLLARLKSGGFFTVNAFTKGNVLEVTSIDFSDGSGAGNQPSEENGGQMPSEAGQMPSNMPSQMASDEQAPPVPGDDFTGQWDSQTDEGNEFTIKMHQDGKIVNGTYDGVDTDYHGTIKGVIKGNELHFSWTLMQYKGKGVFTLSDDGSSFEGTFTAEGQDGEHVWSGNRL